MDVMGWNDTVGMPMTGNGGPRGLDPPYVGVDRRGWFGGTDVELSTLPRCRRDVLLQLVPTLCVGTRFLTLCVE